MTIRSISAVEFRKNMSDALNRVEYGGEQIAITRRDGVSAVMISYKELQELRKGIASPAVRAGFEDRVHRLIDKNEKLYERLKDQ